MAHQSAAEATERMDGDWLTECGVCTGGGVLLEQGQRLLVGKQNQM